MAALDISIKNKLIEKSLMKRAAQIKEKNTPSRTSHADNDNLGKYCQFENFSAYKVFSVIEKAAEQLSIANPFFKQHDKLEAGMTWIDGKKYINYASYNYLNLANEKIVKNHAIAAIKQYGTSVSASRIVSGERKISQALETKLAQTYEVDNAIVFVSGYLTNVTTIGYLFGKKDLILHDALIHNSILQGIQLSGAKRLPFQHNNYQDLEEKLRQERVNYQRVLIVIEGLYSMEGDYPDLPQFIMIKKRYNALLMIDEAHSFGVMGSNGLGIREHFQIKGTAVDIWMGTLSKALAGCGGYIAGNKTLIKLLRYGAPGFMYSVGIAPANAASSLAALNILLAEPKRVHALQKNGQLFVKLAKEKHLNVGLSQGYALVSILLNSSIHAVKIAHVLFQQGINVQPILYPAVDEKMARLRFFLNAYHKEQQIKETIEKLASAMNNLIDNDSQN